MATNYPSSLDTLSNPASNDPMTGHASQHANANDAIEAIQTKLGTTSTAATLPAGATIGKASGVGIKVDTASATWGWRDIIGNLYARAAGASVPTLAAYAGTAVYQYQFSNASTNELFIEFHLPHDYVPGSDIYVHAHWSQTTADSPNAVKWSFSALYAKGHQQQAFQNSVTTVTVTQACSATVRQHMIGEVQLSTSGAIGGNALEVDGMILMRVWRDPADGADTATQAPFLHTVDLHYQSTNLATKGKAPDFWT